MMNKQGFVAAALAALAVIAAAAVPAAAADGTYTQFLCADPDTGRTTHLGAALPEGLTRFSTTSDWGSTVAGSCGYNLTADTTNAVRLEPLQATSVAGGTYAALHYEVTDPVLSIISSEHYGAVQDSTEQNGYHGYLSVRQHAGAASDDPLARLTGADAASWAPGAPVNRGDRSTAFATANRFTTRLDGGRQFTIAAICTPPAGTPSCTQARGLWQYLLFGARIVLRDDAPPTVSAVSGPLTTATTVQGSAQLEFTATDQGSGVYRWKLYDGDNVVTARRIDINDSDCLDVNPVNSDAYEFGRQHPCPATSSSRPFNVPVDRFLEGLQRIRVAVEDAAGNETTVLDRSVVVNNVADPALIEWSHVAPAIDGTPTAGALLHGSAGAWQHADAYSYAWERCDMLGACATIPAAQLLDYTPTPADAGSRLRLAVTGRNSVGETRTERSALTAPVGYAAAAPQTPTTPATPAAPTTPVGQPTQITPHPTAPDLETVIGPQLPPAAPARLTATIGARHALTLRARYTATATAHGRLTDPAGTPIGGAAIIATAAEARPGAAARPIGRTTTRADGSFAYRVGPGPSRAITFTYNATTRATVRTIVRASLSLTVGRARVSRTTWLAGRLVYLRRAGIKLEIQALDGRRWRTFDTTKTKRGGAFRYGYRFKPSAAGRLFALRVLVDSPLYPFAPGASKPARVRVTR